MFRVVFIYGVFVVRLVKVELLLFVVEVNEYSILLKLCRLGLKIDVFLMFCCILGIVKLSVVFINMSVGVVKM